MVIDRFFQNISKSQKILVFGTEYKVTIANQIERFTKLLINGLLISYHPERFAAIGAFSAAIGTEDEQEKNKLQDGPFDPYGLVRKNVAEGKKIPPVYFACGMQDMLWEKVCHYEKFMEENGVDVTWVPVDGFRHEWRFWNIQIEKFLEWIPRTDAYAADQKKHRSV